MKDPKSFEGKVAIVTGASAGIGRAVAKELGSMKMKLALVARRESDLKQTADQSGTECKIYPYDLSQVDGIASLVDQIASDLGGIDALINNAGFAKRFRADEADMKIWDDMINVNLRSAMHLTRYTLPHIQKRGGGAVVNIASISAKQSHAGAGAYSATKHGILGYGNSVFEDIREDGIKVCSICPGFVNTPLVNKYNLKNEKMIQPEDIADTVGFVLRFPDTGCPTEIIIRPQKSPY